MNQQAEFFPVSSSVPVGDTPSWFTPLGWFLEKEREAIQAGRLSGPIMLDVFGHKDAPVTREILRRGGRAFDGGELGDAFKSLWFPLPGPMAPVWLQPPYDAVTIEAALGERQFEQPETLALLPAWTDRGWWHRWIEPARLNGSARVDFVPGRLRYGWPGNPTGLGGDSAQFANALVTWGRR